ncbi:MAG: dephospho-CoA kinase [Clostridia bacterium]|nr:dephospho-CoA kinase [Clostridia bacterium]
MRKIIGLTGPTGAGKSGIKKIAQTMGFKFVDCDILARKAVVKGSEGLNALVAVFGNEILNIDGSLNRKILAKMAFGKPANTELLNKTLLPHIKVLAIKELAEDVNIIFDAPTLFESGLNEICDKTIAVLSDQKIRLCRIIQRDSITEMEAQMRISAGKNDEFYKGRADYIVYNNGGIAEFESEISHILIEIIGGR